MKPTYTLHKLPEGFVIISDEEIKNGDKVYYKHPLHNEGMVTTVEDWNYTKHEPAYTVRHTEGYGVREGYKKVISQQDQIDFSLVKDKITDCKFPINVTGNFENEVFKIHSIGSKEYEIPIVWESYKRYKVEANNLEEAVTKALKQFLSEPDYEYIEDSFSIDDIIYDENPNEDFDIHKIYNSL